MGFLGVYKALYDYVPQGESELAIRDGDILYVLEKSGEDDWWKAKKKASGDDDDEPVGLIPNNYVEEARPTHHARALYDYTRQTDEELSFTEDAQLEVFDTSDPDWILVGLDGEYGFAPANYIEIQELPSEPPPPSLPRRPTVSEKDRSQHQSEPSPVQSPAAAIAGIMNQRQSAAPAARAPPQFTPEASDEDEGPTPALPARPVSQVRAPEPIDTSYAPKSPTSPHGVMASPPYNRASYKGGEDGAPVRSQGGFHMYNINEMVSVMGKRKKMPTTLGINSATGVIMIAPEKSRDGPEQTWTAEKMTHYSIEGKHIFLELVRPSRSIDFHAGAKDTAEEIVGALGELAGAVRAEGLREVILAGSGQSQKKGQVLYDFMAQGDDEVTVAVGDEVIIIDDSKSEEWWQVRRIRNGKEGVVPSSYIEITGTIDAPTVSGINAGRSTVAQNRLEEERLAKESVRASRREEEMRGSEVGPGMRLPERGSSLMAGDSGNIHGQQRREHGRSDSGQARASKSKPDPTKVRTWTDRSKTFSVEAQFLALKDGKINLHKVNGVKIAVPVGKMSVEDLEYVERITGESLDNDKPLLDRKRSRPGERSRDDSSRITAGATIERPKKPEYDWFQFFLSCDVAVGLCERYAQTFARDSMDESVLSDVDSTVLRTLGLREGDIIKVMRFLDKKFGRTGNKRNVSFGGEEVITPDGESPAGLFSGPGGTLRNNTRKGRPAPAVQTSDVVDPKAFSQETPKSATHEGVATPIASAPVPEKKDPVRNGFDDDAWDVKPSKQQPAAAPSPATSAPAPAPAAAPAPAPAPQRPTLTGSMQELSLLTAPLEPVKVQPTAPPVSQPQIMQTPQPQPQPQQQAPPAVTPSFFQGIGGQQTGLQQQQQNTTPTQFTAQTNFPQNIARQRPAAPQLQTQSQGSLMIPAPPNRPLSAPQVNQNSGFGLPPLQPQSTGIQNSSGFQSQIAPPGQSLEELRMRQQYTGFNNPQNGMQNMNMMPQPTGFQYNGMQQPNQQQPMQQQPIQQPIQQQPIQQQPIQQQPIPQQPNSFQYNGMQQPNQQQPNGFQNPLQTGMPQQQFINNGSPFSDPRPQQFAPLQPQPLQPQSTGFQSSFGPQPQQQFPQQTGINSFLPPALQPTPTGIQSNGFNSTFNPPPVPPIPQQTTPMPLVPQKTGPPPPVRFGVTGDTKKLMPQATGRRANLAQATPQNPFGF